MLNNILLLIAVILWIIAGRMMLSNQRKTKKTG